MYQATFGILVNGYDTVRPVTPVRVLSFNCTSEGVFFIPYLEKINCSGGRLEVKTSIKKELEELVGDYENSQYTNKEYKDHFHELDWIGRAYRYIGPGKYRNAFPPFLVTSNPYWLVKEHWEEIAMYQLKEELNFSILSSSVNRVFESCCNAANLILGNGYAR
jgi:hypothetical protein